MNSTRLSSWLLLGGIVTGFLLATWQGHATAAYSKPAAFRRFHQRLGQDALFYPPYSMLENLALARWSPGRTLVIVGGNSILNGVGQPRDEVWSLRLQDLLGSDYVVVNLALRSAYPVQAAALVAESLQERGYPVIYVTNTNPIAGTGLAAGPPHGYFYWQALAQGRLTLFPAREAATAEWLASLSPSEKNRVAEEQLGARLDAWLHHQSLWHHVGYRHFFTVWNFLLADEFWVARGSLPDNEPAARPLAERFQENPDYETNVARGYTSSLAEPDGNGWRLRAASKEELELGIETGFPPALRSHTLLLLEATNPYYLDRLTPAERKRDTAIYDACAETWREHGIACVVAGRDFAPIDYIDRVHLSRDGGYKLAALVAAQVRQLQPPATHVP